MSNKLLYDRIAKSFNRQKFMSLINAKLTKVNYGECEIIIPYSDYVTQQQGGYHGGIIGTIADVSGGYAGYTTLDPNDEIVTVEYKINFLNNFNDGQLRAVGKVIKAGKRIVITKSDVYYSNNSDEEILCATMQQSLMPVKKIY